MKRSTSLLKSLLLALPLLLGLTGFLTAGESFPDSLFSSICMYAMNYQDPPPNLWVEAGRWTAPLATASGILAAASALRGRLRVFLRGCRGNSVAVYGPEPERAALLDQLGRRGIDGGSRLVRAQQYILLGDDALDFYTRHRAGLEGVEVYAQCGALPAQSVSDPGLRLFCPEETAARLFWKAQSLYAYSAAREHRLNIVLLGFGRLGEELLTHGLLDNLFSPDQRIAYHIFGDGGAFPAVHTQLEEIGDPVRFYDVPWYTQLPLLEEADRILVLQQEDQLSLLQSLLLATCRPRFQVFAAETAGIQLLAGRERLDLFHWRREAQSLPNILSDAMYRRAKRVNLRYAHLYDGVPEDRENQEAQWARLDAFTRYSNISAADYHEVRLAMLEALGASPDGLSPALLELLAELEHIRWCRYHLLNNWRRGVPENGKRKDPARRLHADLVPYRELTEAEREKDRENIRVLLSIQNLYS